ncbi:MAG: dTDP-4-dehydrorhamnose reductase [Pseudomonadota bacterium]
MTNILVTGKQGQVARCLAERASQFPKLDLSFASRTDGDVFLDLADRDSIRNAVEQTRPDIIINSAAYTAVDKAEEESELAQQLNGIAPGVLAETAAELNARLVQISTDYVFDGTKSSAYMETDATNPIGVYGRSKLQGEINVRAKLPHATIVRTSWVYSPYGNNFLKTMLRLAADRDELSIVSDQWGQPTSAFEIAEGLLTLSNLWHEGSETGLGETFHLAGAWETNWSGFARKIFKLSSANGGGSASVVDISTEEYPTLAERPKNSRLSTAKFKSLVGYETKPIEVVLEEVIAKL